MFEGSGFSLRPTFELLYHYLMTLDADLLQRLDLTYLWNNIIVGGDQGDTKTEYVEDKR